MSDDETRSLLLVFRHSPYGEGLARAGVDLALACGAFEHPVSLLFAGAGVLQLCPRQDGNSLGLKDIGKQLASLPLYDIESVYFDAEAGTRYGVSPQDSPVPAEPLDAQALQRLLREHRQIISL